MGRFCASQRGSLEPTTFNSIAVRTILVIILGWLIDLVPHPEAKFLWSLPDGMVASGLAFLIGVWPDTWLNKLQERLRYSVDKLTETHPLTHLDGIDLYDRSRLAEEGIN